PWLKLDEQHDAHIAGSAAIDLLPDGDTLQNFGQLFYLAINLRGSNPHAARVESGVAPTVDDVAAVARHLRPVAVPPHARVIIEVRCPVFPAVGIVPEFGGHAGEWLRTHQLAGNETHRPSAIVEHIHRHPQPRCLNLTSIDRQYGIAEYEAGDDVAAAADAGEVHVLLDLPVDVVKAVVRERTSRRENRLELRQLVG